MRHPITLLTVALAVVPFLSSAQEKFGARDGNITFFSHAPLEDITAVNRNAASVLVPTTGAIEFSVLIKAFEFEKAMMQVHFNENYMESSVYPKAKFKGKLQPKSGDDLSKPGSYVVPVDGTLSIHGVDRPLHTEARLTVSPEGTIQASSKFNVRPEDHGISVPGVVRDKIAKSMEVTVEITYRKL